jgi:two-component system invasion response regulator UvrY
MTANTGGWHVTVRPKPDRRAWMPASAGRAGAPQAPKILLIDDHPAVRKGLALVLEAEGLGACLEANGQAEAMEVLQRNLPDLAIVDLSGHNGDTFELLAELRARRIPVLFCLRHDNPALVRRALAAGARGCITSSETPRGIVRVVRAVLDGWMLVSPGAAAGLDDD